MNRESEDFEGQLQGAESLWTPERKRLRTALEQTSPLFADLYGRAIDALSERPPTAGALVVAGHCIRDLVNGLPDVLPDLPSVPPFSDVNGAARSLAAVWATHDIRIDFDVKEPANADGERPTRLVTVSVDLLAAAHEVVTRTNSATDNARTRQSALVLGRVDTGQNATMRVFRESLDLFERMRHPGRNRPIDTSERGLTKVLDALVNIEGALVARLGSFFATVESLTDLLEAANRREGSQSG